MVKSGEMERNANFPSVIIIIHLDLLEKSRINHISGWIPFTITGKIADEKMGRSYVDDGYLKDLLVVKIGVVSVCSLPLMI